MIRDQFIEFLGSFKNAESLSPELRGQISVPTGLEDSLIGALQAGYSVVITGSAGSGKTHLISALVKRLPENIEAATLESEPKRPHVLVVPDATELSLEERLAALRAQKNRIATLIAINEGPLWESARGPGGGIFLETVERLRAAQHGLTGEFNPRIPTVVDLGAYDPLDQGVVAEILGLELLASVVESSQCNCEPEDCPRRRAWKQLSIRDVRARLAETIKLVRLADSGWLFRDLWDFVADLALGGECEANPPSSAWFWRLFYGDSRLSRVLREITEPTSLALPQIDARLYYADWNSSLLKLLPGAHLIAISQSKDSLQPYVWMKAQALLLLEGLDISRRAFGRPGGLLLRRVYEGRIAPIVQAINTYFAYGVKEGSEAILDLCVEHSVERRTEHVRGIIRLGGVDLNQFAIRRSQVLANHPEGREKAGGLVHYLVHTPTQATLLLNQQRLQLIQRGRSLRAADREQADLDWDLCQFFECVLSGVESQKEFSIVHCDLSSMRSRIGRYRVSTNPAVVEEV